MIRVYCEQLMKYIFRGVIVDKHDLWEVFMKTGKVSDYLNYKKAERESFDDDFDYEISEEFYEDDPNLEDFNYDSEDGRYSDS